MNVSRAGFLKICAAVLLGRTADASSLIAPAGGVVAARAPGLLRVPFRVEHASAALFQPHLGTTFAVHSSDGTRMSLVLARVTEQPVTNNVEQFSLGFHARPGAAELHGTHTFQHPTLGTFDLFVGPVGAGTERVVYEACFSRHVSAQDIACR